MRQTGGTALGETSTRSKPRSRAIFRASKGGRMPSCSPFSSMTRTSRARILSLIRINCLAERLSMGFLQKYVGLPRSYSVYRAQFSFLMQFPRRAGSGFCGRCNSRHGILPRCPGLLLSKSGWGPGANLFSSRMTRLLQESIFISRDVPESLGIAYETAHIVGR